MFNLQVGMKYESKMIVKEKDTAKTFGSGDLLVFATPMMVGLMENAALKAVDPHLPKGHNTVGIHLDIKHLAATPIGFEVRAIATLTEIQGKKLTFEIEAYDEKDLIGKGTPKRFIVETGPFLKATEEKKNAKA